MRHSPVEQVRTMLADRLAVAPTITAHQYSASDVYRVTLRDQVTGRHLYSCGVRADNPQHALQRARTRATLAGIPEAIALDAHVQRVRPARPSLEVRELPWTDEVLDAFAGDLEVEKSPHEIELERLRAALAQGARRG